MKSKFLLPARYKTPGWTLLIIGVVLGIPTVIWELSPDFLDFRVFAIAIDSLPNVGGLFVFLDNNILNEILGVSTIVGGLAVAFSREFDEDEFISKIRLDSLVWAFYWNYGILILAFIFVYDLSFYWVMVFNMFTPLLLFIIRFNWLVGVSRNVKKDEEYLKG